MKPKLILQHITKDRSLMVSWIVFAFLVILTSVIFGFRIHPSDINVPVHYSSFGERHIYNDAWYYLLLFIVFGIVVLVLHTLVSIKLFTRKNVYVAKLFIWLSIAIIVTQFFIGSAIMGLADIP